MITKKNYKLILMTAILAVATTMAFTTPIMAATKKTTTAKNSAPVVKYEAPDADGIHTPVNESNGTNLVATDANGDALTFSISVKPKHGKATIDKPIAEGKGAARVYNARLQYQASEYIGMDSITVVVKDSKGAKKSFTVPVEILENQAGGI